jgi:hypothetical protein
MSISKFVQLSLHRSWTAVDRARGKSVG